MQSLFSCSQTFEIYDFDILKAVQSAKGLHCLFTTDNKLRYVNKFDKNINRYSFLHLLTFRLVYCLGQS